MTLRQLGLAVVSGVLIWLTLGWVLSFAWALRHEDETTGSRVLAAAILVSLWLVVATLQFCERRRP